MAVAVCWHEGQTARHARFLFAAAEGRTGGTGLWACSVTLCIVAAGWRWTGQHPVYQGGKTSGLEDIQTAFTVLPHAGYIQADNSCVHISTRSRGNMDFSTVSSTDTPGSGKRLITTFMLSPTQ